MRNAPAILFTSLLVSTSVGALADDIILRLRPDAAAPIISRITATEKVLLDAAPAGDKGEWMQLDLEIPFEGYVPASTLTKGLAIAAETPVRFLPEPHSETITRAKDGDLYEIQRVNDKWATVTFKKQLTTYFRAGAPASELLTPRAEPAPPPSTKPPAPDLTVTAPTHTPEPKATEFDASLGVGQTSPEDLPPENVVWKSGPRAPAPVRKPQAKAAPAEATPPQLPKGIMVGPGQTQAREADSAKPPPKDQPLRLLAGTLVREIETADPNYPVRLRSDEGRLVAYVDFSGFFIEDLSPYLDQRVYLRGHVGPVGPDSRELVIFVRDIKIAE